MFLTCSLTNPYNDKLAFVWNKYFRQKKTKSGTLPVKTDMLTTMLWELSIWISGHWHQCSCLLTGLKIKTCNIMIKKNLFTASFLLTNIKSVRVLCLHDTSSLMKGQTFPNFTNHLCFCFLDICVFPAD